VGKRRGRESAFMTATSGDIGLLILAAFTLDQVAFVFKKGKKRRIVDD
jgi:hypothetical protein